jgi:hypothetical protein
VCNRISGSLSSCVSSGCCDSSGSSVSRGCCGSSGSSGSSDSSRVMGVSVQSY